MCNIRLQAPTLARKCANSYWLPRGKDGRIDGQTVRRTYCQVTFGQFLGWIDDQIFLKGFVRARGAPLRLIYIAIFFFVSEFQTVHGRILAVNMAHLRKKRQTAGNDTDGEHVYKEIVKINKGIQITWLNKFIYLLLK